MVDHGPFEINQCVLKSTIGWPCSFHTWYRSTVVSLYDWCFNKGILMVDLGQPWSFRKQNTSKLLSSFPLLANYGLYLLNFVYHGLQMPKIGPTRSFFNWCGLLMATSNMILVVHVSFIPNIGRPWSLHTWCWSVMFFLYPTLFKHFHSQY